MAHLEITTKIGCKNQCIYCPQDRFIKAYSKRSSISSMNFDTFKKCIDKVPKNVGIHFSGFSEPYLNPACTKMILYAHKKGFKISIATTGVGMRIPDIEAIKDIPLERFEIHLPDNKKQTKIKVDSAYLNIIKRLLDSNIKNIGYGLPEAKGLKGVHPKLKKLLINSNVPQVEYMVITRARNVKIKGLSLPRKIKGLMPRCERLRGNILLPNGDVALCCMDWGLKHILGNLLTSDYDSIFKSKEFLKLLKGHKDDSLDVLCRYCDCAPTKRMLIWRGINFLQRLVKSINN